MLAGPAGQLRQVLGCGVDDEVADRTFLDSVEFLVNIGLPHHESAQNGVVVGVEQGLHPEHPLGELVTVDFDLLVHRNVDQPVNC